jgi:predicted DNA-binding protein (UPF0251 family)
VARRLCDLENLVNEEAIARVGLQRHIKKVMLVCVNYMKKVAISKHNAV